MDAETARALAAMKARLEELEARPDLTDAVHAIAGRVTKLENALPDDHVGPAPGKLNEAGEVVP